MKFDLLENHFKDPWQILVVCMLLNRTTRKQVDRVVYKLFDKYSNALEMSRADVDNVASIIRSLGFQNRRSASLVKMSKQWLEGSSVEELSGIGRYAIDSYKIFVLKDYSVVPEDYALKNYLKHRLEPFTVCPECTIKLTKKMSCTECGWKHPTIVRRLNMKKYYKVEALLASKIEESIEAKSLEEAKSKISNRYSTIEAGNRVYSAQVNIQKIEEERQMSLF